jgi:hypothetical protein
MISAFSYCCILNYIRFAYSECSLFSIISNSEISGHTVTNAAHILENLLFLSLFSSSFDLFVMIIIFLAILLYITMIEYHDITGWANFGASFSL